MNFMKEANRIYLTDGEDNIIAELNFPNVKEQVVEANRTFVDASLRGQGVAGKLMDELVAFLEESNQKLIPTCSYAVKWLQDRPEYSHLVVTQ